MEHPEVVALIQNAKVHETDAINRALLNLDALPIPWAWVGCFGIRANGNVVYVDDDGVQMPLEATGDDRMNAVATLVYAAERNPDLVCILPEKPVTANSCSTCNGTGRVLVPSLLCGDCMGLGWIDAKKGK
jgi:hypothetical protein